MNKYRFEILISALDALPDDIKDSKVGKSTNIGIIRQLRGMYRRYVKYIRLNNHIFNAEFLIKESLIKPEDVRWVHAMGCE
jgi:hypothetical protein